MAGVCRPTANGWKVEPVIELSGLYKIFGSDPAGLLPRVRDEGVGKDDLLDRYNGVLGLRDINLSIPARTIQVVMGLSGSGKSTLIRHINRLIDPTAGQVVVDGEDVMALSKAQLRDFRCRKIAMVFQRFALMPHRTVSQNVAFGLEIQRFDKAEIARRVSYWVERVGLGGNGDQYPNQLSGGMQQRVGLARALATDADILLMDEAFSALDPLIRRDMQGMLLDLQAELKKTIVFITHDLDEALRVGDDIVILRDGAVVQQGNAQDIVLRPADDYIADFVQDINLGKVIRLASIMRPMTAGLTGPALDGSMLLADAVRFFAAADADTALVTGEAGRVVGAITARDVMGAMVRG